MTKADGWRRVSADPVAPQVHKFMLQELGDAHGHPINDIDDFFDVRVENASVLDIGVVEHAATHFDSPSWRHAKLAAAAKRCVGVDVVEEAIVTLRCRGFDIRLVDATGDEDLGERFDVVIAADVIEHVDNPVAMLHFCVRHLREGGEIYITTPNPFFWRHLVRLQREKVFVANAEHVTWVTPSMACELAYRTGLRLHAYHLLVPHSRRGPKGILKRFISRFVSDELLGYAYLYRFRQ